MKKIVLKFRQNCAVYFKDANVNCDPESVLNDNRRSGCLIQYFPFAINKSGDRQGRVRIACYSTTVAARVASYTENEAKNSRFEQIEPQTQS